MQFLLDQKYFTDNNQLADYVPFLIERLATLGYGNPVDFIKLPGDQDLLAEVKNLAHSKNPGGLKWLILVGIGGSSLGVEAICQALGKSGGAELKHQLATLTVVDTVDPTAVAQTLNQINNTSLNAEELLLVVVSKSGQTTETAANAAVVYQALAAKFGGEVIRDRVVAISDQASPLIELAEREGFATANIPNLVGGRFSVFSAAGLLPLAVCGVDVDELVVGAQNVNEQFLNQAGQSAIFLAEAYKQGKNIHDFFVFSKQLEGVGKWYRQLLAESIGKDGTGLAPTVLVGSTDLHSQAQLVFGGPDNRVTTLVSIEHSASDPIIPPTSGFASLVDGLGGKSLGATMQAIYAGTLAAYQEANLPVMEIRLVELSAKEIGQLMQFLLIQVICLGKLLNVNAYDQPAVENYKSKTRKILLS